MRVEIEDVGFGYSPFPHELSRDTRISLQAKGLFAVYGSFVKVSNPTAWASEEYLCKLCGGINEKSLRKYKRELVQAGWISQVQRRRENGQHSTLVITRYFSPRLNPHRVESSVISTGDQKTVVRKTAVRKLVPQEQQTSFRNNKEHTEQLGALAGVCVCSSGAVDPEVLACIEWTIDEYRKTGQLKNEIGLRTHLLRAASVGKLDLEGYRGFLTARNRSVEAVNGLMEKIEDWERECQDDPITADFFEEQKKLYPGLFAGSAELRSQKSPSGVPTKRV